LAPTTSITTTLATRITVPSAAGPSGPTIAAIGGQRARGDTIESRKKAVASRVYRGGTEPEWGCSGEGISCRAPEERLRKANIINFAWQFEVGGGYLL
jgi:hypothetical protein